MDLSVITAEYNKVFGPQWFTVGASKLYIGYVGICAEEHEFLKCATEMSLQEYISMIFKCVKGWSEVKLPSGDDFEFNLENLMTALSRSPDFLEKVSSICFNKRNFLERVNG